MGYRKKIKVKRDEELTNDMLADINEMATNITAFKRLFEEYGVEKLDRSMGEVIEDYATLQKHYKYMNALEEQTRTMERIFELPNVNENVVEDFETITNKWKRKLAELNGEY